MDIKKGEDPILIRNAWFEYKNLLASDLLAMRVKGNSMSPHLENEDIVLININDIETVDDEIYAVVYNGRFFIKKIRHTGAGIDLISLNRDYETIKVLNSDAHSLAVLGKKVWRGG